MPNKIYLTKDDILQTSMLGLTCSFCNETKPLQDFTDVNQQRGGIHYIDEKNYPKNKRKNEVVTCKACSYKPSKTMECDNCEEEKDLKQFSKLQRKQEYPWCQACVMNKDEDDENSG